LEGSHEGSLGSVEQEGGEGSSGSDGEGSSGEDGEVSPVEEGSLRNVALDADVLNNTDMKSLSSGDLDKLMTNDDENKDLNEILCGLPPLPLAMRLMTDRQTDRRTGELMVAFFSPKGWNKSSQDESNDDRNNTDNNIDKRTEKHEEEPYDDDDIEYEKDLEVYTSLGSATVPTTPIEIFSVVNTSTGIYICIIIHTYSFIYLFL
jgi:hypothetical protein